MLKPGRAKNGFYQLKNDGFNPAGKADILWKNYNLRQLFMCVLLIEKLLRNGQNDGEFRKRYIP